MRALRIFIYHFVNWIIFQPLLVEFYVYSVECERHPLDLYIYIYLITNISYFLNEYSNSRKIQTIEQFISDVVNQGSAIGGGGGRNTSLPNHEKFSFSLSVSKKFSCILSEKTPLSFERNHDIPPPPPPMLAASRHLYR